MHTRSTIVALALIAISLGSGCGSGEIQPGDVSVAVMPDGASVATQGSVTFTATVTGTTPDQSKAVTWSVEEVGGGTVSPSGQYTAPTTAGTYHVIATSVARTSMRHRTAVTVTQPTGVSVSITPSSASISTGSTVSFTATVSGTSSAQSTAVTWSVQEVGGGTVDSSGHYTAPATVGTYHVIATSVADSSKHAYAAVQVTAATSISVSVSPATATIQASTSFTFTATVSGTSPGQSTAVTWSVQEAGGGTVDSSGHYTAPATAGSYHVIATSVADPSKHGTATVQVTATPNISVTVSPVTATIQPSTSFTFTATVTGTSGGQSTAVTWSVQEAGGGTVDSAGHYTAPATQGTYHVVATSVADPSKFAVATVTVVAFSLLPPDRATVWNPGVTGGIPVRNTICTTINASTYGNGTQDASAGIQTALNACPLGQVVQLSAGVFTINNNYLLINRGITLRGAGATSTTLQRTNGATPHNPSAPVNDPVVIIGPNRWPSPDSSTSQNLTADGAKGSYSVTVANGSGFAAGQFVLLDEDDYNTGSWTSLPNRGGAPTTVTIWASDRAVFQRHNPPEQYVDDPFPASLTWFSRSGRPVNEIKEVASVSGNTITFTTPLHISYRASHAAQLTRYTGNNVHVKNAGLEGVKVIGGGDGAVRFEAAAYSWMKDVEDTIWLGEGVAIDNSFRIEVRGSFIHDTAWPVPGGSGYAFSFANGSSEALIENNIVIGANKMMVARSSGTASVVGYNYMDDGFIDYNQGWQEVGLNGSHMVGSHHMLFEGNESFNYDADCTHGNAIYHTVFRNHLSGFRRDYPEDPLSGNRRAGGLEYGAWWHSFIGNVMGTLGRMTGWVYEDPGTIPGPNPWQDGSFIWRLGYDPAHWEQAADPLVQSSVLRHGNFDYVSNLVNWDPNISGRSIPNSLYLSQAPAFFNAGRGYVWPWVDPTGATRLSTLPAKARYDAGTPFIQP